MISILNFYMEPDWKKVVKVGIKIQDTGRNGTCYCHWMNGNKMCGCKISTKTKQEELNATHNPKCKCGHYISEHFDWYALYINNF